MSRDQSLQPRPVHPDRMVRCYPIRRDTKYSILTMIARMQNRPPCAARWSLQLKVSDIVSLPQSAGDSTPVNRTYLQDHLSRQFLFPSGRAMIVANGGQLSRLIRSFLLMAYVHSAALMIDCEGRRIFALIYQYINCILEANGGIQHKGVSGHSRPYVVVPHGQGLEKVGQCFTTRRPTLSILLWIVRNHQEPSGPE